MQNIIGIGGAAAVGLLMLASPAFAIYRESTVPQTDQSEQIPSKTIKLDQDTPSTDQKKKKEVVKPREPERPRQATRKPAKEETDKGNSADTNRAIGTMLDIGIGVGMGMGRRGGEMGGMRDR